MGFTRWQQSSRNVPVRENILFVKVSCFPISKMPFTEADYLPSMEELTVPEINLSAAPMRAAAFHFGKYCDNQSKEFMLCMAEEKDPRRCLMEGKEVTRCGMEFFQKVKGNCAEEFTTYWQCIDHARWDMNYSLCKKQQFVFDGCMSEKVGLDRPEPGYFSKVRVHHTQRAKPTRDIELPPDTPEMDMEKLKNMPPPETVKQGWRNVFH